MEVLVGKDKGKQGFVTQVITERNWVICEGLNWHYRRVAAEDGFPGIIIKSEAPLDVKDTHNVYANVAHTLSLYLSISFRLPKIYV